MIALVRDVITAATFAGLTSQCSPTSHNTGVAPTAVTDCSKLRQTYVGKITSSPTPQPRACKASTSAAVPLPTATAPLPPTHAASRVSNSRQRSPCPTQDESNAAVVASWSSAAIQG